MTNWDVIREEWETTKITFKALAEKHGIKEGTLKSRRSREGWSRDATDATKRTGKSERVATNKRAASGNVEKKASSNGRKKKQRNRSGNPNPKNQFTERNRAAVKHGLFSRYIPKETMEIMGMIAGSDTSSLLWMQIELQFAAIIRAQQIMFVEDKEETIKELKKRKVFDGELSSSEEEEWEIQFAWDRHATFLNAQSRAISELRTSIRQFEELIEDKDDERLLRIELMRQQIDKGKLELSNLRGETEGDAHAQGSSYEDALNAQVDDVFADEVTDDEA